MAKATQKQKAHESQLTAKAVAEDLEVLNLGYKLDDMPVEIILHICSFLDAKFVIKTLSNVCRYLNDIINDDVPWKIRINRKWKSDYLPAKVNLDNFDWKSACIEREEQYDLWSNPNKLTFAEWPLHHSSVDSVLLTKDSLLATGSRDRSLKFWDVSKIDHNNPSEFKDLLVKSINDAHRGWIWAVDSMGDKLISASWDTKVKVWAMDRDFEEIFSVPCRTAALCLAVKENMLAVGVYDKKVLMFDPRQGYRPISWYTRHSRAVLSLVMDSNYIVSGSEDRSCIVWDRRVWPGKPLKTIVIGNAYVVSMHYNNDMILMGDISGKVHLLDPTNGLFNILTTFPTGHTRNLTDVHHTCGCVITSSIDRSIRVFHPTDPPNVIRVLGDFGGEVAALDYRNNILAAACSDRMIRIWVPRPESYNN